MIQSLCRNGLCQYCQSATDHAPGIARTMLLQPCQNSRSDCRAGSLCGCRDSDRPVNIDSVENMVKMAVTGNNSLASLKLKVVSSLSTVPTMSMNARSASTQG